MRAHWRLSHRAVLLAILLTPAAAAQERASSEFGRGQPDGSAATQDPSSGKSTSGKSESGNQDANATSGTSNAAAAPKTALATFGAGCFWHVEDIFEQQKGVLSAVSGYSGGNVPYPSYEMVHTGETGHAECVQVEYDPSVISYEALLKIFWSCHDPTSINRQGEDEGPQYRSVIFYHSEAQRKAALKSYEQLTRARVFRLPIVTQLVPMQAFFPAEDYHQNYYANLRGTAPRRRRAASSKTKIVPRKSNQAGRTAQNSRSKSASGKGGSSALSTKNSKSAAKQNERSSPSESGSATSSLGCADSGDFFLKTEAAPRNFPVFCSENRLRSV